MMRTSQLRARRQTSEIIAPWYTPAPILSGSPDFPGITRYEWTAESLALALADLDLIASWVDVSQGLALAQAMTSLKPQFLASYNGYPGASFNGATSIIEGDSSAIDTSGGATVFIVWTLRTYASFAGPLILDSGDASSDDDRLEFYTNSTSGSAHRIITATNRQATTGVLQSANTAFATGSDAMITAELWDAGRGLFSGRTVVDASASGGTLVVSADHTRIALGVGFSLNTADCVIRNIVIYDGQLIPTQVTAVWDSLESRWGGPF